LKGCDAQSAALYSKKTVRKSILLKRKGILWGVTPVCVQKRRRGGLMYGGVGMFLDLASGIAGS
jgi:hypothetical protein